MFNKKELKIKSTAKKLAKPKDVIFDPEGQRKYPGEITKIPSGNISMKGISYPVLGIDDLGNKQMMYPEMNYRFPGNTVTEYPQVQKGGSMKKYVKVLGGPGDGKNKKKSAPVDLYRPEVTLNPHDSTYLAKQMASPIYDPTKYDYRTVEQNIGKKNAYTDVYKKNLKSGVETQLQPQAWDPMAQKQFMFNQAIQQGQTPQYPPTFWPTPEQQLQIQQMQSTAGTKAYGGPMHKYFQTGGPTNAVDPNSTMSSYTKGNTRYVKDLTDKGWYTAAPKNIDTVAPIQKEIIPQGQMQTGYTTNVAGATNYFIPRGNSWVPATDSEFSRLGYDTTNVNPYTPKIDNTPINQQQTQQLSGQPLATRKNGGDIPRFEDTSFVDDKKNNFLKWLRTKSLNVIHDQMQNEHDQFVQQHQMPDGSMMDNDQMRYGGCMEYGGMMQYGGEGSPENDAFWANQPSQDRNQGNNTYSKGIVPFIPVPEDPRLTALKAGYSNRQGTFGPSGNQISGPYGQMPQTQNSYLSSQSPSYGQQTINLPANQNLALNNQNAPQAPKVQTTTMDPTQTRTQVPTQNQPQKKGSFDWQSMIPDGETQALKTIAGIDTITSLLDAKRRKKREKELRAQTHADMVYTSLPANMTSRGDYSVNEGYFKADQQVPVQYSKRGGQYKANQDYYLSNAEAEKLRSQGYQIFEY